MFICVQMCFHCTRSSTCGTHCYWVTPPSPSVLAWPYCSSSGTVSWLMASMSASSCSLTCQVRKWAGIFIFGNTNFQVHSRQDLTAAFVISASAVTNRSAFPKPDLKVVHLYLQLACTGDCSSFLRVLLCADVFEFMISSKHAALHSLTYILPPWWALGVLRCALYLSTSQTAAPWELYATVITTSLVLQHSHHFLSTFWDLSL